MAGELSVRAVHMGGMRVLARGGNHQVITDYPIPPDRPVEGLTSLELLLASLASCAATVVLAILKRQLSQPVTGLEVRARGPRRAEHPTVISAISLEFVVMGAVEAEAVAMALSLSEKQLCPVWNMLKTGTPISATYRIVP